MAHAAMREGEGARGERAARTCEALSFVVVLIPLRFEGKTRSPSRLTTPLRTAPEQHTRSGRVGFPVRADVLSWLRLRVCSQTAQRADAGRGVWRKAERAATCLQERRVRVVPNAGVPARTKKGK